MSEIHEIYCQECKRVIGTISIRGNNRIQYLEQDGLISCRLRKDGNWGFECEDCGSYSLVEPGEVDEVIGKSRLNNRTRAMLMGIKKRKKASVKLVGGYKEVDGFRMRSIG